MKRYNTYSVLMSAFIAASGFAYSENLVQTDSLANTAMGSGALSHAVFPGTSNTAAGGGALFSNTTGWQNTAIGFAAMQFNTTGRDNTASGTQALFSNTTGSSNTASGVTSLYLNVSGSRNSGFGMFALYGNTTGSNNTANGYSALSFNTTGDYNTASGAGALYGNTTGDSNTAVGVQSLQSNTTGGSNTATGSSAMQNNLTGTNNTAIGESALISNRTGSNNIAVGYYAGSNIVQGYRNIDIGNSGSGADAGTIRIGTAASQSATFIAGINGAHVTGSAVYISSTGQLGVLASSERYKTGIAPMGKSTENLQQLRPVTFQLKTDRKGTVQYGLIAEEVAMVYPELVIRDETGKIQGVRYEELAPMLLNEVQQLRQQMTELKELNRATQAALADLHRIAGVAAKR